MTEFFLRCKEQTEHLRICEKKNLTYVFSLQSYLRKKRRVKQLKEASVSGEAWCEVQKKRKGKDRIQVKKKTTTTENFFLKVQVTD